VSAWIVELSLVVKGHQLTIAMCFKWTWVCRRIGHVVESSKVTRHKVDNVNPANTNSHEKTWKWGISVNEGKNCSERETRWRILGVLQTKGPSLQSMSSSNEFKWLSIRSKMTSLTNDCSHSAHVSVPAQSKVRREEKVWVISWSIYRLWCRLLLTLFSSCFYLSQMPRFLSENRKMARQDGEKRSQAIRQKKFWSVA
jgi:hypothetical protein